MLARFITITALLVISYDAASAAPTAEVLHWWTSGGEAKALEILKKDFEKAGGSWVDVPIAGGGGDTARSVLKSRFVAGNPPVAAQMHMGPQVWDWGKEGALANIDAIATKENWNKLLPPLIQERVKYNGQYVAVPVNIHRVNWMWTNPNVLAKVKAKAPTTWQEFNEVAEKLKGVGITPLAHGGQPWQDVILFDTVALGVGGPDFYRKAFIEMDQATLSGPTMIQVFDQMRKLKGYTDKASAGRDWNLATAMVIKGEAGMQIMGDWVKGEFNAAGKKAGTDFVCTASPGSSTSFSVNNDSFAFFKVTGEDKQKGQAILANLVLSAPFQESFSLQKGSIPARMGISKAHFDLCGQKAMDDFVTASAKGAAVPSISSGGIPDAITGSISDVITNHFNSNQTSQDAVAMLVRAVQSAKAE